MCGTYYVDDETLQDIERIIREVDRNKRAGAHADAWHHDIQTGAWHHDIHPTQAAPIIGAKENHLILEEQTWGYPGIQQKGVIFNARAESVLEKKMFREDVTQNRIVIPVKHFYEWNTNKEKSTFSRDDGQPLFLAGFYGEFQDMKRFIILTCEANESMRQVHSRMPLILEVAQLQDWILNADRTATILRQVPILLKRESPYEQQTMFGL